MAKSPLSVSADIKVRSPLPVRATYGPTQVGLPGGAALTVKLSKPVRSRNCSGTT